MTENIIDGMNLERATAFIRKCASDEGYTGEIASRSEFDRWLDAIRAAPTKDEILAEIDRRWPHPNTALYDGLRIGFELGAEWAGNRND